MAIPRPAIPTTRLVAGGLGGRVEAEIAVFDPGVLGRPTHDDRVKGRPVHGFTGEKGQSSFQSSHTFMEEVYGSGVNLTRSDS